MSKEVLRLLYFVSFGLLSEDLKFIPNLDCIHNLYQSEDTSKKTLNLKQMMSEGLVLWDKNNVENTPNHPLTNDGGWRQFKSKIASFERSVCQFHISEMYKARKSEFVILRSMRSKEFNFEFCRNVKDDFLSNAIGYFVGNPLNAHQIDLLVKVLWNKNATFVLLQAMALTKYKRSNDSTVFDKLMKMYFAAEVNGDDDVRKERKQMFIDYMTETALLMIDGKKTTFRAPGRKQKLNDLFKRDWKYFAHVIKTKTFCFL